MSAKLHSDIEQYIDHFRGEHSKLKEVKHRLHRKVQVVMMLDALARGRYPETQYRKFGSRDRFLNLIEQHSNWPHATSVSTSQLMMMIQERGGAAACGVSDELDTWLDDWSKRHKPSRVDGLGIDPSSTELLQQHPNERELKLVDEAKHSSLLYEYRCVLVHEYREPGHGFEFNETDMAPSYQDAQREDGRKNVELVYPAGWFLSLVPPILDSLAAYYDREGYNPYDSYRFGSPWRRHSRSVRSSSN
ncbi:MAG: hypothetical protein ACK4TP_12030 [Hyphomicrobium sp.]